MSQKSKRDRARKEVQRAEAFEQKVRQAEAALDDPSLTTDQKSERLAAILGPLPGLSHDFLSDVVEKRVSAHAIVDELARKYELNKSAVESGLRRLDQRLAEGRRAVKATEQSLKAGDRAAAERQLGRAQEAQVDTEDAIREINERIGSIEPVSGNKGPAYMIEQMPNPEQIASIRAAVQQDLDAGRTDAPAIVANNAGDLPVLIHPGSQTIPNAEGLMARADEIARAPRTLYHYTSTSHWPTIQKAGYLKTVESNVSMDREHAGPDVVHLTDELNLSPATAGWASRSVVDKTEVRITVHVNDAEAWLPFVRRHGAKEEWIRNLTVGVGEIDGWPAQTGEHWYVVQRPIPATEWGEVRIRDIPVGKQPITRTPPPGSIVRAMDGRTIGRVTGDERPVWQTSHGTEARCDFCGQDEALATYRYGCKPFEIDGWTNGDGVDPRQADWGACWFCTELIEAKDLAGLQARSSVTMRANRSALVRQGGKHSSDTGRYEQENSTARIAGFFKHRTRKRVFVGKCDICSLRGETVRWLYPASAYEHRHPLSGEMIITDTPWCICDACAKLIDRADRAGDRGDAARAKPLIERALEHQLERWSEVQGRTLSSRERGAVRQGMVSWLDAFLRHRTGPKEFIPDLPARIEPPPQAPIAAQVALDQKLTLLRWAEGSDGRQYLGGWNDRYSGDQEGPRRNRERNATENEIKVWTHPLRYGEAFYLEPRIAVSMREAAEELVENTAAPWALQPELLPAAQGFFYSDVPIGEVAGFPMRAIGWSIAWNLQPGRESTTTPGRQAFTIELPLHGGDNPADAHGVVLTFWSERPQGDRVLRPSGQLVWRYGIDHRRIFASPEAEAEADKHSERPQIFAAMLAFIQQRIVVAGHPMGVSSAARKRIEREYPEHEPTVRVITLRRRQRLDYARPEEPTGRHLTVQFKVRGHWHESHCMNPFGHREAEETGMGCKDHQAIYIPSHMRGPEGAPLKLYKGAVWDMAR